MTLIIYPFDSKRNLTKRHTSCSMSWYSETLGARVKGMTVLRRLDYQKLYLKLLSVGRAQG